MTHVFEASGLGAPPFRFVTAIALPAPSLAERNTTAYNRAMGEAARAARALGVHLGTCNHCGTAIQINCVIRNGAGSMFVVGTDCACKTGDGNLVKPIRRAAAQRLKIAKARATRVSRNERRRATFAEHGETLRLAYANRNRVAFARSVLRTVLRTGQVSDAQLSAIGRAIENQNETDVRDAAERARKVAARHVGTVGERLDITLTKLHAFQGGNMWNPYTVSILRDAEGNTFVTYGVCRIEKGETARVRATVKAHKIFRDEPQTQLTRIQVAGAGL